MSTSLPMTLAPVCAVTVFRNGALVTRSGRASAGTVHVGSLPLLLNSDSLRVRATNGEVREVEETCFLNSRPATAPAPKQERRALNLEEQRLNAALARIETRLVLYRDVGPGQTGKMSAKEMPNAGSWIALHRFAGRRLEALSAERDQLLAEKRELARKLEDFDQAERGDREPPSFSRGLSFELVSDENELDFEVEYFVPAARWVPSYTLHLDTAHLDTAHLDTAHLDTGSPRGPRARLSLSALVAQATGEDWSDVRLSFSTANLARETQLPELGSWRLGRAQSRIRPAFRELPTDLETLFADYAAGLKRSRKPTKPASLAAVAGSAGFDDQASPAMLAEATLSIADDCVAVAGYGEAAEPEVVRAAPVRAMAMKRAPRKTKAAFGQAPGDRARSAPTPSAATPSHRPPVPAPPNPLPPRLRYAYLRLAGPEESHAGTLRPIDPLKHLWSLVRDHRTTNLADLRRAVEALKQAGARLARSPTPPGTTPLAQTSFHHVYNATSPREVATDGEFHRLLVTTMETDVATHFRVVPRANQDIYRFCHLQAMNGSSPYPSGPLHVYQDGEFRVTTQLKGTGGGEGIEVNLGIEEGLSMTGRKIDVQQRETGVVSQKSKIEHQVRIGLRSALNQEALVVVYDRLPTAGDDEKELEVRLLETTPEAAENGSDPAGEKLAGGLHREVRLAAGQRGEVSYRYEISLPAGSELVGGNRRE